MRKFKIIFLLLTLWSVKVLAESPSELARQAETLYQSGQYPAALEAWKKIESTVPNSGDALAYNLGNAYWRLGQVGQARRYFLRAQTLNPRNADARHNLEFLETKLGWKNPPPEGGSASLFAGIPWWRAALTFSESLWGFCVFWSVFLLAQALRVRRQKRWTWLWWTLPVGFFFAAHLGYQSYLQTSGARGVVIAREAPLLKLPVTETATGQNLKEGDLVHVKKRQGDFVWIETNRGDKAWVARPQIGEIL